MKFRRTIAPGAIVRCVHEGHRHDHLRMGRRYKVTAVQTDEDGFVRVQVAPHPGYWWGLFRFRTVRP